MTSSSTLDEDLGDAKDESCSDKCKKALKTLLGILYATLTGVLFATATTAVNIAESHGIPTFQILFLAYVSLFIFAVLLCAFHRENVFKAGSKTVAVLLSTGFFRWLALLLSYFAYMYVAFGDVTAIVRGITPVLTPLLAFCFLHEQWTMVEVSLTALNIIGVVAVAGPFNMFVESTPIEVGNLTDSAVDNKTETPINTNAAIGYSLTVGCGISFSLSYILARSLGDGGTVYCRLFYDSLTGTVLSLVPLLVVTTHPVWSMAPALAATIALYCVVDAVALFALYRSFQLEFAATVSMLLNIEVVATYIYQATIFREAPNPFKLAGASIIMLSSVLIAIIKWRRKQKQEGERKTLLQDYTSLTDNETLLNNNPGR
ncbi:solute carrier family 35 member G1-like [Ptychodera flava]|uniref:solute carrier family 35 member G1-like n=1 Tax=Ptychodera flava TaxID=63121 RepID=UPI00396AB0BD